MFPIGSTWNYALTQSVHFMPVFIVYLVGLILAVNRWHRHPRASMFAVWGFLILIVVRIVTAAIQIWLYDSLITSGGQGFVTYTLYLEVSSSLVYVLGLGFVVAAIFVGRGDESQPVYHAPLLELPEDRPREPAPPSALETGIRERRTP